jgi:excisionase family DNA binding protein
MIDNLPLVMTIEEASKYLRIPLSSLYKLAQGGKIPCQKVGRHWRFHQETLKEWLAGKKPSLNHENLINET